MLYSVGLDGEITPNGPKEAAGYGTSPCGAKVMEA